MTRDEIVEWFHSDETLTSIRKRVGIRYKTVRDIWVSEFGETAVNDRKRRCYRASKLGTKNPMKGKYKRASPVWKENDIISDRKGYVRVRAPDWYTGKVTGGYVDEHVLVYCKTRGLQKIPDGFVVHHLDMDKKNNTPSNLVILTNSDHLLLHAWITRAIVQRLSVME